MAEIALFTSIPAPGVARYFWETLTESDTAAAAKPGGTEPAIGSFQVTGTFGSATIILQGSNDGTNYVTIKDVDGVAVSLTAAGAQEFSSSMLHYRASTSGGSSSDVDVTLILRG